MASLLFPKWTQFELAAGTPAASYWLHFCTTGTSTAKDAYSDVDATTPVDNPYQLNSAGRPADNIYISGKYRVVLHSTNDLLTGSSIADVDPVEDGVRASAFQAASPTYGGNNSGTSTALVFALAPVITSYTNGMELRGRITASATGPFTVNWGGGVKSLVDSAGNAITHLVGPNVIGATYDSTTDVFRLSSGQNSLLLGTHTIVVLAGSMLSRTTNGAADGLTELTTNDVMLRSKDFDQTTSEGVQFDVPMPKSWNEGTVTLQYGWTAASGTGTVTWAASALAFSDDDAMDTAFPAAVNVTDTLLTANDMHISSVSAAVTIGGTPAESDSVKFQIARDVSDTLNADAKLLWAKVFFTLNAGNDA